MPQPLQQALIVDDSKTARVSLRKLLEKHRIGVSVVESGEEALVFLRDHRPDVIFMDHMMPGMDGFAAVKAIKANPQTSAIPIVMHTTIGDDIYAGQARALGAITLLPKPPSDDDVTVVLDQVQTVVSKQQQAVAAETSSTRRPRPKLSSDTIELNAYAVAMAAELAEQKQRAAREALALEALNSTTGSFAAVTDQESPSEFWGSLRQWFFVVVWLIPILWLLFLYIPAQRQLDVLASQQQQYVDTLQWLANQRESYDFGEEPMSGSVLQLLQGLVPRLSNAGFKGVIRLEGHIGEFCLSRVTLADGSTIAMLPEPDMPLTACAMIGYSQAQAVQESQAQSEAFRQYLQTAGLLAADAPIRVDVVGMGSRYPQFVYPEELEALTTGDWNAIALRNNRVHIELIPTPQ